MPAPPPETRRAPMDINLPDVVAEVTAAHLKYNQALASDDLDTLDELFWKDPRTLRYGPNGTLLGHAAISAFRRGRKIKATPRVLKNTVVTTFGRDTGTTNTETTKPGSTVIGRRSQTWIRVA